jgi:hypothetical protein
MVSLAPDPTSGRLVKYLCCWIGNDPDSWTEIEAFDWDDAATSYVEQLCKRENESYSSFEGGDIVQVKVAGGAPRSFEVTMEMRPHFSARARL